MSGLTSLKLGRLLASALGVCALALGCHQTTIVGSIECAKREDCSPPATICGVDSRCVPGCATLAGSCAAGAACDSSTGECAGGIIGTPCTDDRSCDAPEIVCRPASQSCAAGCSLSGACPSGLACDRSTGRCCDPGEPGCQVPDGAMSECGSDADCGSPARTCLANVCVAGCSPVSSCSAPLQCDAATGHCVVSTCVHDTDCDATSRCARPGDCEVIPTQGRGPCAGGKTVAYRCAVEETAAAFASCAGAAGPRACPYCIDGSCFVPGVCGSVADCGPDEHCSDGLCRPLEIECPSIVPIAAVRSGAFPAGKTLCVRDRVASVRTGYDGLIEIKLGASPFLFADVLVMYKQAGLKIPGPGDTVTLRGRVRWDEGHADWELLPVDWISP